MVYYGLTTFSPWYNTALTMIFNHGNFVKYHWFFCKKPMVFLPWFNNGSFSLGMHILNAAGFKMCILQALQTAPQCIRQILQNYNGWMAVQLHSNSGMPKFNVQVINLDGQLVKLSCKVQHLCDIWNRKIISEKYAKKHFQIKTIFEISIFLRFQVFVTRFTPTNLWKGGTGCLSTI